MKSKITQKRVPLSPGGIEQLRQKHKREGRVTQFAQNFFSQRHPEWKLDTDFRAYLWKDEKWMEMALMIVNGGNDFVAQEKKKQVTMELECNKLELEIQLKMYRRENSENKNAMF